MSTIRRVYFYAVSFITLGIFAAGLQTLLRLLLDLIEGTSRVRIETPGFAAQQLSLGLAMLIIGGTLWLLFWRAVRKQVAGSTVETGSTIRKLYLNFIITLAGLISLFMAVNFLNWLLAGVPERDFPSGGLATLVVAVLIWFNHRRVSEKEGHPSPAARTLRRWNIYILSAWGLVALTVALVQFLTNTILHLPFWGESVSGSFWNASLRGNISWILVGGSAWAFHWFSVAGQDADSTLRQVYLYLLTILGGAVAGLAALTTTLYTIIRFAIGGLDVTTGLHFHPLGWTVPTMLVAAAVWTYHQQVVSEEETELSLGGASPRRVLWYLMSFIGLGTIIAGLIMLFGLILELLTNAFGGSGLIAVSPGWWRQQMGLVLALLIVGIPLWVYYWRKVLLLVSGGGVREWRARSRRTYLYVIIGVAIITLAADMVNIVYQLLNGLLQGTMGMEVYRDLRWSLQTLIIAAPVLLYHWRVLRQDQGPAEEKLAVPKAVTILAGESGAELATRIEEKLGSRTVRLRFLGEAAGDLAALSDEEIDKLVGEIQAAPGDKVMLIAKEGKIMMLPYQEQ